MQPKSCRLIPDIRRVIRFTYAEARRRNHVSWRCSRIVPTRSWPLSNSATRRGISSGGFCRSASSVTTNAPREAAKPAVTAACWPKLRGKERTRISGSRRACAASFSTVRSFDPSSTSTTSNVRPSFRNTGINRSHKRSTFSSSLKTGTTTERKGAVASAATGSLVRGNHALHSGDDAILHGRREQRGQRQREDRLPRRLGRRQVAGAEAVLLGVEAVQVHGREVQPHADAGLAQLAHEL